MRKILLLTILIVILASSLVIGSCSEPTETPTSTTPEPTSSPTATPTATPTSAGPKSGGTFTFMADRSPAGNIGWPAETFTMVPQYMLYNSLITAWWDGSVSPELATSWDIDVNTPSITFHLREGVKFHDGSDFNAEAVKFNFDPMIEAKKRADWKSVDVVDEYTVRVNLNSWRNTILPVFDGNPIVSQKAVEDNGIDWIKLNPVGTGPYVFESFVQDERMVLKKNPNYWEEGIPYVDTYEIIYVPDYVTRKNAMITKEADMMLVEFGKEAADFRDMDDIELWVQPQATAFMVMDDLNEDSPFYHKEVREAVDYAIDRQWLADNLGFGYWEPCYQLPPRNNEAYIQNYVGREHDVQKAKDLLAAAGYTDGFDTELIPNPTALIKDTWVAVQAQLAEAGIRAELRFLEVGAFDEYRNTGQWKNAIIGDNLPAYGNYGQGLLQDFAPNAEFFQSLNKNRPDWAAAIDAATTIVDFDAELLREASKILYDNVTVIPIAEGGRGTVYQSYVKDPGIGERNAYFWAWDWTHFWLDK